MYSQIIHALNGGGANVDPSTRIRIKKILFIIYLKSMMCNVRVIIHLHTGGGGLKVIRCCRAVVYKGGCFQSLVRRLRSVVNDNMVKCSVQHISCTRWWSFCEGNVLSTELAFIFLKTFKWNDSIASFCE